MSALDTIITLTLSSSDRLDGQGTLLIQRGPLAHLTQFTYISVEDITAAIQSAYVALAAVENDPPIIPEAEPVPPIAMSSRATKPVTSAEPMLTIPVGKKTLDIPARYLQLAQPDQQPLALQIASKLIGGKLWDGQHPIFIADVHQTFKQLKHLDEKSLAMFVLEDFVQVGAMEPVAASTDEDLNEADFTDAEAEISLTIGMTIQLMEGATDTDGDPVAFNTGRIVEIDDSEQPLRVWIESLDGENDVWVSADHIQPLTTAR